MVQNENTPLMNKGIYCYSSDEAGNQMEKNGKISKNWKMLIL